MFTSKGWFGKIVIFFIIIIASIFGTLKIDAYLEKKDSSVITKSVECIPLVTTLKGYIEDPDSHDKWSTVRVEVDPKCAPCHSPSERTNLSKLHCPARPVKTKE